MRKFRFLLLIPLLAAAPYAAPGTSYGAALQESGAQESAQQEGATTPPAGDIGDEGGSLEIFGRWRFLPELSHDVQERFQFPMKRDRRDEEDARAAGGRGGGAGSNAGSRQAGGSSQSAVGGGGGGGRGDGGFGRRVLFARTSFTPQTIVIEREGTTLRVQEDDQVRSIDTSGGKIREVMGGGRWETIGSYEDGVLTLRSTIDMGGVSRFGYQLDPETGHLITTLRVHPRVMSQPFTVRRVYERDESSEPAVETPEQARDSN